MKNKYLITSILSIIVLAGLFILLLGRMEPEFECQDPLGCVTIKPGEPVRIASLQPLSGHLTDIGAEQIRGTQLALSRRNHQFLDHPIELQIEDSQCSPEGGAVAALKVAAEPRIIAVMGTTCSGAAIQASRIISEAGRVMISGVNTAASLTSHDGEAGIDWYPGYFRTMFNSVRRGEAGALFAYKELGLTKAATINDGDKRSEELTEIFERTFKTLGGEIVLSTQIDRQDTNMRPVLNRIADVGAELIFFPFFPPETVYVTRQARELPGLKTTALMVCGASVRKEAFIKDVGDAGKGMYFVGRPPLSGLAWEQLKSEYEAKYQQKHDELYAFAFDAVNLLLNAMASVVVQEKDGTLHIGREALRDAMYEIKDYEGITGRLSCDEFGDCGTPTFNIVRLDDPDAGLKGLLENEVFRYTLEN